MNARDGLLQIREQLIERDARTETIDLVDTMLKRASTPGAERAQASLPQLVKMLARTQVANNNIKVYDELAELQDEVEAAASRKVSERDAQESRPLPKKKKYYKQQKQNS